MPEQRSLDFKPKPDLNDLRRAAQEALALAERLARLNGPSAEHAFKDAEHIAIKCPDMETQMLALERSGDFHKRYGAMKIAGEKYRIALQSARCIAVVSDAGVEAEYRLRYKLRSIQKNNCNAFKNLEKAAGPADTYEMRFKAWRSYENEPERSVDRLAARGIGSKDDFRKRLDAAKLDTGSDEDDEDA